MPLEIVTLSSLTAGIRGAEVRRMPFGPAGSGGFCVVVPEAGSLVCPAAYRAVGPEVFCPAGPERSRGAGRYSGRVEAVECSGSRCPGKSHRAEPEPSRRVAFAVVGADAAVPVVDPGEHFAGIAVQVDTFDTVLHSDDYRTVRFGYDRRDHPVEGPPAGHRGDGHYGPERIGAGRLCPGHQLACAAGNLAEGGRNIFVQGFAFDIDPQQRSSPGVPNGTFARAGSGPEQQLRGVCRNGGCRRVGGGVYAGSLPVHGFGRSFAGPDGCLRCFGDGKGRRKCENGPAQRNGDCGRGGDSAAHRVGQLRCSHGSDFRFWEPVRTNLTKSCGKSGRASGRTPLKTSGKPVKMSGTVFG